jgi:hypothetical protein
MEKSVLESAALSEKVVTRSGLTRHADSARATTGREPSGLLTTAEILGMLRISRRTLHEHVRKGTIPVVKLGHRTIFHWPSVEAALLRLQRAADRGGV